ncbi:SusC/RagA family TonB-linked outer membrane protein [uncultured Acetobacteroides sp.]|uniref:SusC/RagA family TonB-linked outer membrane protein n=1 Tax=uncultured Acetobacteroides sp. TaxID=1760811 RepID=UPI0029F522C3|nr:SusC/RagA family TonB-linked outer membrane protein [uncultured Acetobacteroides sp.]
MTKRLVLFLFVLLIAFAAEAQVRNVRGKVLDKNNQPIPGVNITLKGSKLASSTGISGEFLIKVSEANSKITFRMVGYKSQEVVVGKQNDLVVILEEENIQLQEAIVLGYGSKKSRESVVGAVEQISAKDLQVDRATESVDKMLEGRMAGILVENNSGDPGSASVSIQVRGQGSLTQVTSSDIVASSQPLFIIDGIPMLDASNPNIDKAFNQGVTQTNPLSLINPNDIETITVLKDAATSAIYGANAANGVILITTKKGKAGKATFNISQSFSVANVINSVKYLNTEDYVKLAIEAQVNSGISLEDAKLKAGATDINTNWYDLVLRQGFTSQTNMSVSGGSERTTYRFSAGYNNTKSVSKGNDLYRITSRLNLNTKLTDKLDFDAVFGFSMANKDVFSMFSGAFALKPNLSPYNADGTFNTNPPFDKAYVNPLAALAQNKNQKKDYNTNGNVSLTYHILKDLSFKTSMSVDYTNARTYVFNSKKNASGATSGGMIKDIYNSTFAWDNFNQLEWNKTFDDKHNVSVLAGMEISDKSSNGLRATEKNLPMEKLPIIGYGATENVDASASESSEGTISYYSRVGYSYDSKYNVSVNFRRDASSIFGGDVQAKNFASIGATWVLSKENWFPTDLVPLATLRASYGSTGNSKIGTYSARGTYAYGSSYVYNGEAGAIPRSAPNLDLTWEQNYKLNIGFDASFLKSRIGITFDYYRNTVIGGIQSLYIPLESGFSTVSANTSDMVNEGFEFTLKTKNINSKDFKWRSNFNISSNSNRLTKLANNLDKLPPSSYSYNGLKLGKDVSSIYTARYAGVDPQTGTALWYLKDGTITTDGVLANKIENRVYAGKASPDFFGGFVNDFEYKDFTLSIVMSYNIGGKKTIPYSYLNTNSDGRQILIHNQTVNQLDRWTTPGQITDVPKLSLDNYVGYGSTRYLYDMTNINFKTLSLAYKLPSKWIKRIKIDNASINTQISNLAYWYKDKKGGSGNGIAEYRYGFPESRQITFGIDLRF